MALRIAIVVLLSFSFCVQCGKARTFSSLDEIRGNGSFLVNVGPDVRTTDQFVLFPNMRFNCPGHIEKVKFLALPNSVKFTLPNRDPIFGIAQFGSGKKYKIKHWPFDTTQNGRIFEQNFRPTQMKYEVGDVFAIKQSGYNLLYNMDDTIDLLRCSEVTNEIQMHMCVNDSGYQPLLTIETENPECISGFVSDGVFRHVTELITRHPQQLMPVILCSGVSIKKLTVGARPSWHGPPQCMSCDFHSCDRWPCYFCDQLTVFSTTSYLNVYEYEPSSAFTQECFEHFLTDNIFLIQYQRCALEVCVNRLLVAVELSGCPGDCSNCSHGFMEVEELREKARYIPNFAENTTNQSFPDLNITQDGFLVKWTFTGHETHPRPPWRKEYPQLIILPSDFRGGGAINCSDDRVRCLNSSTSAPTEYPNVYESTVDPRVPVNVGDYIAVHHPSNERAAMRLMFVRIPPVEPLTINSSEQLPLHPLVHLHIVPKQTTSIPNERACTVATVEPSRTPRPKDQLDRDNPASHDSNISVLAGGVVGGVLAAVVTTVIAALLVVAVLRTKHRNKRTTAQIEGTTNPVYDTSSTQPAKLTDTGEHTLTSQIYAEPNTTNGAGGGHAMTTIHCHPVAQYSEVTEGSTVLNNTIDTITNAEYFHTQSTVHTENHYEFAVYVPTKEQREQLSQSEANVYSTLEEAQVGREKEKLSFFDECETYWDPAESRDELYAQLANRKYREIPSHLIRETGHLGSGEFGTVNRGVWQDGGRCVDVAVKKLKDDCSEEEGVRFLQEAAIMGQFRHPNIVQLLGVVTIVKPVMIVTELAHNGNLREYLLSNYSTNPGELPSPDTPGLLLQFCVQVARGMEYLSGKAFVHRDLAARNILITDSKNCKISDFGLTRDLDDSYYVSRGGQIPIKWTAPEALHYKKYSTASDVWSFGCLIYEIWSLGHKPFEGYTNIEAIRVVDRGQRLAPPPGCPKEIYRLMIICWNAEKSGRPQFREIVETLSQPESLLLHIPEEVSRGHPQASVLGAPLEAGSYTYPDLQNRYNTE